MFGPLAAFRYLLQVSRFSLRPPGCRWYPHDQVMSRSAAFRRKLVIAAAGGPPIDSIATLLTSGLHQLRQLWSRQIEWSIDSCHPE